MKLKIALALLALCLPYTAQAQSIEDKHFDDWVVRCDQNANGQKRCYLSQTLTIKETGKVALAIKLGYVGPNKELVMAAYVPAGVLLPMQLLGDIDQTGQFKIPYQQCSSGYCEASMIVDDALAAKMKAGSRFVMSFRMFNATQGVSVPSSLKGITKGLAALKSQ